MTCLFAIGAVLLLAAIIAGALIKASAHHDDDAMADAHLSAEWPGAVVYDYTDRRLF